MHQNDIIEKLRWDVMDEIVTIKDIARLADVSIGTIDRILHDRGRYSKKTAEKVQKIIKETGYKPNPMARSLSRKKPYRFGIVMPLPDQDNSYWAPVLLGIEEAKLRFKGFNVIIENFFYDRTIDNDFERVKIAIAASFVDGLLIAPTPLDDSDAFIDSLKIPVVIFDTQVADMDKVLGFIGQDSYQSGALSGKLSSLLISEGAEITVISPATANRHNMLRGKGFIDYLNKLGFSNIRTEELESSDKVKGYELLTKQFISQHYFPDLIFTTDESGFMVEKLNQQLLKAFQSDGESGAAAKRIKTVTYDLVPSNRLAIAAGMVDFTIVQMPGRQGYEGMLMLFKQVVLREPFEKEVKMPLVIVTAENIDSYQDL